jgi:hypothetical protein
MTLGAADREVCTGTARGMGQPVLNNSGKGKSMKPIIKPSSELRRNYNSIAAICKESHEPVFLTKNGEGDTVIMDMETNTAGCYQQNAIGSSMRL